MNYEDEYYEDEDDYGYSRSYEDSFCVSPSTAAQFPEPVNHSHLTRLSNEDRARLNSCLDELRNILGQSVSDSVMSAVVIQNNFNFETSLNQLLTAQDGPETQSEPRQKRSHSQDDIDSNELDGLLNEIKSVEDESLHNAMYETSQLRLNFGKNNRGPKNGTIVSDDTNKRSSACVRFGKENQKFDDKNLQNKPKQAGVSLAELAKQRNVCDSSRHGPSLVPGKQNASLSLAELARQHKKTSNSSLTPGNPVKSTFSNSVADSNVKLSALVAQHSGNAGVGGMTTSNSAKSNISAKTQDTNSPHGNKTKSSLMELIAQGNNGPKSMQGKASPLNQSQTQKVSLSDLAHQYQSLAIKSPGQSLKTAKVSQVPSVKEDRKCLNLSTEVSKISLKNISTARNIPKKQHQSGGVSLASCLKTSSPSSSPRQTQLSESKVLSDEDMSTDSIDALSDSSATKSVPEMVISHENADPSLMTHSSPMGLVMCCLKRKKHSYSDSKRLKYPRLACLTQVSGMKVYEEDISLLKDIVPFNFSVLSPDDIVKHRQNQAFTRSDKEFET